MIKKFKEVSLELYTDNLEKYHVRLDNILDGQYFNLLTTTNKSQALGLFKDLCDVLEKHKEN